MTITITLPDFLAARLQSEAQAQNRSAEEVAVELLDQSLRSTLPVSNQSEADVFCLTPEEVVAKIKALPPNPANQFDMKVLMAGLVDYLEKSIASEDPNEPFDQEEWQRQWDAMEAEMKAVSRANNIAEGRG